MEREWETSFGGNNYMVNISQPNGMMCFELEDMRTNDRWSGEFTAQCKWLWQYYFPYTIFSPTVFFPIPLTPLCFVPHRRRRDHSQGRQLQEV